jgi:lipopolysaccharide/colanic/teichoic acid biosynthesis glycosyltransferase
LKKVYFFVTRGRNRLLSKAEVLGRLISCGFEIVEIENINGLLYFIVRKIKEPEFNMHPSYGPLFKMKRLGKNGKIIGVYKFRTMHPYAEYLQDYILKTNGYSETGKPANDFRLTPWGKLFRKYWIDEIPQLINVLKGELKIVGIRPISVRYFQDIPKHIQDLRIKQKPGCIPPYVSLDRKSSVEEVLKAEYEYLLEKEKKPYTTDIKYFTLAIFNILIKRKRSA